MSTEPVARHCHRLRTLMANVFLAASADGRDAPWVLIDTGLPGHTSAIREAAAELFDRPPSAIVLTHGHFDHVGNVRALADTWRVPVYAHPLELPYVTGRSSYPPPDPSAGGGLLSLLAAMNPRRPIDLGARVRPLPERGGVPDLPAWRWVATPGHTPGHVSLFRDEDRVLLAGDAVATTKQESLASVLLQRKVVSRPPAYMTTDWQAAGRSVRTLAALEPETLAAGHGHAMRGDEMRRELHALADHFERVVPTHGRYARQPVVADEYGVVFVPPREGLSTAARTAIAAGAIAGLTMMLAARRRGDALRAHR